jgi:light-regulated signal transduction histidine kinase (bacteriophytochrome)
MRGWYSVPSMRSCSRPRRRIVAGGAVRARLAAGVQRQHRGVVRAGQVPAGIAVAHTDPADRIKVSVRLHDGQAVIAVTDSGCGIPPTDLDRIFGRFARAEPYRSREAGGFALGLPIVQAITEAHHGAIRVHSASGHGATFELVIPAAPELTPSGNSAEP